MLRPLGELNREYSPEGPLDVPETWYNPARVRVAPVVRFTTCTMWEAWEATNTPSYHAATSTGALRGADSAGPVAFPIAPFPASRYTKQPTAEGEGVGELEGVGAPVPVAVGEALCEAGAEGVSLKVAPAPGGLGLGAGWRS